MLTFRPIEPFDLIRSNSQKIQKEFKTNEIDSLSLDSPTVLSELPYSPDRSEFNKFEDNSLFYKSTHVDLSLPIVNIFLSGTNYTSIKRLIPKEYKVDDLIKGSAILDISGVVPVTIPIHTSFSSIPYDYINHKIGGEAIKYLLDLIDPEERICDYLMDAVRREFGYKKSEDKKSKFDIGYINKGSGDIWIVDEYWLVLEFEEFREGAEEKANSIRYDLLVSDTGKGIFIATISVLLALRDNRSAITGVIQSKIPIMPLGYRPTIDKKKDPLSTLYNDLIRESNKLRDCLNRVNCSLEDVRSGYARMHERYLNLVYKKGPYKDDKYIPIKELLSGKEGILRGEVQGARIDFSGRSVITVDPNMPIDHIGIPKDMAYNLCELEVLDCWKSKYSNKTIDVRRARSKVREKAIELLQDSYVVVGRQPTLYQLGMAAYKARVVDGSSIVLNPIVTPAFNADFDGDQMYVNRPQTPEAKQEVEKLISNIRNTFYARDGSCIYSPRQEMIYGLYMCHTAKAKVNSRIYSFSSVDDFKSKIIDRLESQDCLITDRCIINGSDVGTIGYATLKYFLGGTERQKIRLGITPISTDSKIPEKIVTEKFFKELFGYIKMEGTDSEFTTIINNYVKLGFTIANLYAPDINILKQVYTDDIKEEFDKAIAEREEMYNLGFDTETSFNLFYSDKNEELEKKVRKRVLDTLGSDHGFVKLVDSGARGSKSNLLQMFGMKGTIKKNQVESFNVSIKRPLAEGLRSLEHFIAAYGSRDGIIDKVIGTFKPGYLSRLMSHVARHIHVVSRDCGTSEGLSITYDLLLKYIGPENLTGEDKVDYFKVKDYAVRIITGRFIVGQDSVEPLSKSQAEQVFCYNIASLGEDKVIRLEGIKLRSPITCEDQCCSKCYGIDLATNTLVAVGTPIGPMASQTIGEPVTQLIMKNFQKGGVAGVKNLTTSFDTIKELFEMTNVSDDSSGNKAIIHDFISPVAGKIFKKSKGDGTAILNILNDKGKNILTKKVIVYDSIKLKDYVEVGETIQVEPGIMDVNEIIRVRGADEAQMHVLFNAYNIFLNEVYVDIKHFEVLINGMTLYLCSKGNDEFKVGNYYSIKEKNTGNSEGCEFIKLIRGIKEVPKVRADFLTAVYLEDINEAVARNILTSGVDHLVDPYVRATLGLPIGTGSDIEDYMETRGVR